MLKYLKKNFTCKRTLTFVSQVVSTDAGDVELHQLDLLVNSERKKTVRAISQGNDKSLAPVPAGNEQFV
jgi:hypothetical protein